MHLSKIENIKNTMLISFSGQDGLGGIGGGRILDRDRVEERIQETKNQIRMEQEINNI